MPTTQTDASEAIRHTSSGGERRRRRARAVAARCAAARRRPRRASRVVLEQHVRNPYAEPLRVTYQCRCRPTRAVSGFAFRIGERRVTGEVDREAARARALRGGDPRGPHRGAARPGAREPLHAGVGNIPPRTRGRRARSRSTSGSLAARRRVGVAVSDRRRAALPRRARARARTAARVTVDVADAPIAARASSCALRARRAAPGRAPSRRRTRCRFEGRAGGVRRRASAQSGSGARSRRRRALAGRGPERGRARWTSRARRGAASRARPTALLTLVPPRVEPARRLPRDLIVLLDTSGSMGGAPLDQARRVVAALIDSLDEHDCLELIEFSTQPRRWRRRRDGDRGTRAEARRVASSAEAGGGTEMRTRHCRGARAAARRRAAPGGARDRRPDRLRGGDRGRAICQQLPRRLAAAHRRRRLGGEPLAHARRRRARAAAWR